MQHARVHAGFTSHQINNNTCRPLDIGIVAHLYCRLVDCRPVGCLPLCLSPTQLYYMAYQHISREKSPCAGRNCEFV
jgi:hypothetical protein